MGGFRRSVETIHGIVNSHHHKTALHSIGLGLIQIRSSEGTQTCMPFLNSNMCVCINVSIYGVCVCVCVHAWVCVCVCLCVCVCVCLIQLTFTRWLRSWPQSIRLTNSSRKSRQSVSWVAGIVSCFSFSGARVATPPILNISRVTTEY